MIVVADNDATGQLHLVHHLSDRRGGLHRRLSAGLHADVFGRNAVLGQVPAANLSLRELGPQAMAARGDDARRQFAAIEI